MGKAKDGSECFTKKNKSGGTYVTCKGTQSSNKKVPLAQQKKSKAAQEKRKAAAKPKAAPKPKPKAAPKPKPAPKPSVSKDDFLDVMNIIGSRNKQRISESIRPQLEQYSIAQLKKAIRKDYEEKNPGRTITQRGGEKSAIIDAFIKNKVDIKFLPKTARKEPTQKYTLEGFGIADDETGEIPSYLSDLLPNTSTWESGLTAISGKLTKKQANELAIGMKAQGQDGWARFYRETAQSRIHFWKDPL
tara:strand:+ start:497 stop:1234 length:738 start_codon:yes stop_codon:yes gene_type:complete